MRERGRETDRKSEREKEVDRMKERESEREGGRQGGRQRERIDTAWLIDYLGDKINIFQTKKHRLLTLACVMSKVAKRYIYVPTSFM